MPASSGSGAGVAPPPHMCFYHMCVFFWEHSCVLLWKYCSWLLSAQCSVEQVQQVPRCQDFTISFHSVVRAWTVNKIPQAWVLGFSNCHSKHSILEAEVCIEVQIWGEAQLFSLKWLLLLFVCLTPWCVRARHRTHMEVRGRLKGVRSLSTIWNLGMEPRLSGWIASAKASSQPEASSSKDTNPTLRAPPL